MHFKASVKKLSHSFKSSGKVLHKRGPVVTKTPLIEVVAHTIPLTIKLRLERYMLTLIHILILTYTVSYTLRNSVHFRLWTRLTLAAAVVW